ncbi:MAG: serine hydrolase, partial [Candidatus Methanoperedens sp.]|nr:serine hydrolase [Candidatus Methanoperedens sp.]
MIDLIRSSLLDEHQDLNSAFMLLDQWTQYKVHRLHQPGLALGVVFKGNLIWAKGYGLADRELGAPVTLATRFRVASISKTFTATAIMQLRDAGMLRLDDPVSEHLDWFTVQYPDAPPITICHLLTHTSGLPRDGARSMWESDDFHTWEEVVELMPERVPTMPPVQEFSYSNLGYAVLGGVVQAVSGECWADYVQRHILDPLEMTDTLTSVEGGVPNLATGYLREDADGHRKPMHVVDAKGFDPATGMASTLRDLAKYARFHLSTEDNGVLSPHTLRDMHRVHWLDANWKGGYGLGIGISRIGDYTLSGHGGGYKGFLTGFLISREH